MPHTVRSVLSRVFSLTPFPPLSEPATEPVMYVTVLVPYCTIQGTPKYSHDPLSD